MDKLSFANRQKLKFFLPFLKPEHKIIDLGCGNMWLTNYLKKLGYDCIGFDESFPADIVGNVKTYTFKEAFFDAVFALEIVEHIDCTEEIKRMLKPGGILMVSTPVPYMDRLLRIGEHLSIFQKRTSPHSNLIYLKKIPLKLIKKKNLFGIVQCGVFQKV